MPVSRKPVSTINREHAQQMFRGRFPSLWNFWRDGVTSSFIDLYLTCAEQTRLKYVEGWQSRNVPIYFEFGTCCHWIEEQAYGRDFNVFRRFVSKPGQLKSLVGELVGEYEKLWLKQVKMPSPSQIKQQDEVYGMAEVVMPLFFQRWDGDFNGKYTFRNDSAKPVKWHSLEEIFCHKYTFKDGKVTFLRGRRDGLFYDAKNRLWVFDTKCRSMIDHEEILETLPFDFQQMLYLWVTHEEMVAKNIKPYWPAGTIMNVIRRPQQRQGVNETDKEFFARIEKEYKKDIATADPKKMKYIRYEMKVKSEEIESWKQKQLDPIMTDLREWWDGTRQHFARTKFLTSKYGRAEMYQPFVNNDFSNCYRREAVFPELALAA